MKPAPEVKVAPLLRVCVLSDERLLNEAVAALLERSPRVQAEPVLSIAAISARLACSTPGVVVWWVRHADATTFETVDWIRQVQGVPVCLVAASIDVGALRRMLTTSSERVAVVVRDDDLKPADLLRVLVQLVTGRVVLSPVLLEQIMRDIHTDERDILAQLTPSELAVFDLVAMGFRNTEIARRLGRSRKLVEKNVSRIFGKLGLSQDSVTDRRVTAVRMYLLATRGRGSVRAAPHHEAAPVQVVPARLRDDIADSA